MPPKRMAWWGLLLGALILVQVVGSLFWVERNVVLVGHDASGYLGTALEIAEFFTALTPTTIFRALTYDDYRTTALYLMAQPFFWWFGATMDSAQLPNILLLAAVIALTYALGVTLADRRAAWLAAALVGLLPMMTAMARLFYTEMLLTALVALNLLALYKSRGFQVRRWAVIWGVSLGAGLLAKWTMPVYIALPVVVTLWQTRGDGASAAAGRQPRTVGLRAAGPRAALAALIGIAVATVWAWPNRDSLATFQLGNWLVLGWALLATGAAFWLLAPSTRGHNFGAGVTLGALIASTWYLPYIDFAARLLAEDSVRGKESIALLNVDLYLRYFEYLWRHHFGALLFLLITPFGFGPWLLAALRRRPIAVDAGILWWSLVSAYLALVFLSQSNPRNLIPLLPGVAVLVAVGAQQYRRPWPVVIAASWLLVLGVQWAILTFDALTPLRERTAALWVSDDYSLAPASGPTDPGFWIGPEVLAEITAGRDGMQWLGMLVNSHEVHRGMLRYLVTASDAPIRIVTLTEEGVDAWFRLFSAPWLLVKDGENYNVSAAGQAVIARILAGDPIFHALYAPVRAFPLPNGETATLYHRTRLPEHPTGDTARIAQLRPLAEMVARSDSAAATVVYASPDLALWVGMLDPAPRRAIVIDARQPAARDKLPAPAGTWLVIWDEATSTTLRPWLDEAGYRAGEVGDATAAVAVYGFPAQTPGAVEVTARWPDGEIATLHTLPALTGGEVLPVELTYRGAIEPDAKLSLRLLDAQGQVIASQDFPLAPTMRAGLFAPPDVVTGAAAGTAQLVAVRYDGATGAVQADTAGNSPTLLTTLALQPGVSQ